MIQYKIDSLLISSSHLILDIINRIPSKKLHIHCYKETDQQPINIDCLH